MKIVLTVCGLVLAGLLTMPVARAEGMPGTPTVLVPTTSVHTSQVKPVIAGVTQSGTQVDVYLDNQFYGHATVVEGHHGTAHWSYVPFLNLTHGWHTIQVKAQNASGGRSVVSQPTYLFVDLLVPSPTLLTPVVNADTVASKPWIVGLTTGGMTLDVWIDGELNGSMEVEGAKGETVSFKYQPFLPLTTGTHIVSVTAKDSYGGMSQAANSNFTVYSQIQRTVSSVTAVTEDTSSEDQQAPVVETAEPATEAEKAEEKPVETIQPVEPSTPAETITEEPVAPDELVAEPTAPTAEETATEEPTEEAADTAAPEEEKNSNVLSTVGWVLLALVAIGMITRGRGKKPEGDQLVKIDTTGSNPHVEVIRKPESAQTTTSTPATSSTPPTPPTPPTTPTI